MIITTKCLKNLVFLICLVFPYKYSFTQSANLDSDKWVNILQKKDRSVYDSLHLLITQLEKTDSSKAIIFLDDLAVKGESKGDQFHALYNCIKGRYIFFKSSYYKFYQDRNSSISQERVKKELIKLYSSAIDLAYKLEDDVLVAYLSYNYASSIYIYGELGLAVMYGKNGIDLFEKLSFSGLPEQYQFLAEILYKVREYNESIQYAKKAADGWRNSPLQDKERYIVNSLNTVALGFHRQQLFDSAIFYYQKALIIAKDKKDTIWVGIVSGNMGQILYQRGDYDSAYTLMKYDYSQSKKYKYFDNAANSLQWAARANLARGNTDIALNEVREAFQLLRIWPDRSYLCNAYYTCSQIFRQKGNYDSAFYYSSLYSNLNDSLEKVVAISSLSISNARLNDETSRYKIQSLNRKKEKEIVMRNILIASIVIFSIFFLLLINRNRLKAKLKMEKAELDKRLVEKEMASAKLQLDMFTKHIIEKTSMIEKLETQIRDKQLSAEQQSIISELSLQTILTEADWLSFKTLFEKIYPLFFNVLKDKFPGITVAEQRMAALIRLQLSTKHMASMLGISVDSVHKTRQRLRQRLHFNTEINLEEAIASL